MMTDPIADMLTRIRNAQSIRRKSVDIPHSKIKEGIADVLLREGYIRGFETLPGKKHDQLRVQLKYGPSGEHVISHIQRVSKPGRRIYSAADDMPSPLSGLGICIVTTNRGLKSNRECRQEGLGGELLAEVW